MTELLLTIPQAAVLVFNRFLSALGPRSSLLTGCSHLGPKTVAVDRFDDSTAIGDSWKQQTLLNLVKLRSMLQIMQAFASYLDVPEAQLQDSTRSPFRRNRSI